ncbi:hypothetical protein [Clostridium guangxiense]|uniref:hypothetical protein n=1 Tax=Clostridium guangxiense TaxID=1662055 RepID=UPI001E39AD99|nr:hypothetical protein [Clostridium guangxiense]MCD2345137.1 hypothetical protein [Clostridium guangxiense]
MKIDVNKFDLNVSDDFDKKVGKLTNNEIVKLLKVIENNLMNKKYIDENVFFRLIKIIKNRSEYAQTFFEYKKLLICIEKLLWLIKKNIDCEYNEKQEKEYDNIMKIDPDVRNSVIRLLDLENEREEKLMSFFKIHNS